jgi:hypothetical protein
MVVTFGAAEQAVLQILLPENLLAVVALHPEPFGLDALLLGRFNRLLFFTKPNHDSDCSIESLIH